jgi:hypothetical protein
MKKILLALILLALFPDMSYAQEREPLGIHEAVIVWGYYVQCPWHNISQEVDALYSAFNYEDETTRSQLINVSAEWLGDGWRLYDIVLRITFKDNWPTSMWDVDGFVYYDLIVPNGFPGYITRSTLISQAYAIGVQHEEVGR